MVTKKTLFYGAILVLTVVAPFLFPAYRSQLATLWLMIIVSMTWDMNGGQMGYNSLGNIFFYGTGMYVAAIITIALVYNVGAYTDASGGGKFAFTPTQYFTGILVGSIGAGIFSAFCAVVIGYITFGLRGPYFAIGTLGVAIAAGELVSNWDWVGGGQGIALPVYPNDLDEGKIFFYFLFATLGVAVFIFVKWLYGTRRPKVMLSMTWDMNGGQMGYNSLGNIFFYGTGMYVAAIITIALVYNVGAYTDASGGGKFAFTPTQYFTGILVGSIGAGIFSAFCAVVIGYITFGLRGPYFAIGTLGVAIAAGELVSNWDWVGGGQGIALPVYPNDLDEGKIFFYFLFATLGVAVFIFVKWLYGTRFGAAMNAIRDDEQKAEAMGIHTLRYKLLTWAMAAFFVGIAGAFSAFQLIHFEPLETAYQTINLGIFMVVCVLLGGKGTLWGPVIGAILFHVFKEVTWTYFLGWQWVALGALIVVTVVYFQDGIMGAIKRRRPDWFGETIDKKSRVVSAHAGAGE